ncbi:hypothetical protein GJ699_21240 [Duganella sp. FT80W]|uniref:Uncharacterized protein n=1 Tax=Duganella guangzhouensis TaxID=2666084 RepID=A0A6I2L322_9BURK|nr:hypothetical protein [Duganella guangzhouensis]MRW92528.1 hypothetical protein [Duganella guangzhouensis]
MSIRQAKKKALYAAKLTDARARTVDVQGSAERDLMRVEAYLNATCDEFVASMEYALSSFPSLEHSALIGKRGRARR